MNTIPDVNERTGKTQAIAIMTLVNGILNILAGITLTILVVVGTIGFGLICSPITILPSVLGIFEIINSTKLMGHPPRKYDVQTFAILEICTIITLNVVSLIIGILNLVFYNDGETRQYIDSLPK